MIYYRQAGNEDTLVHGMSLQSLKYLVGYLVRAVKVKYIPRFVISLAESSVDFAPLTPHMAYSHQLRFSWEFSLFIKLPTILGTYGKHGIAAQ